MNSDIVRVKPYLRVDKVMSPQRSDLVLSTDIPNCEIDVLVLDCLHVESFEKDLEQFRQTFRPKYVVVNPLYTITHRYFSTHLPSLPLLIPPPPLSLSLCLHPSFSLAHTLTLSLSLSSSHHFLPMVGIVVTISPSLSLYRMVVFPAASSPTTHGQEGKRHVY